MTLSQTFPQSHLVRPFIIKAACDHIESFSYKALTQQFQVEFLGSYSYHWEFGHIHNNHGNHFCAALHQIVSADGVIYMVPTTS